MSLSNSQYDAIMRTYQQQQLQNRHEQENRIAEVYKKIPAIKELDDSISSCAVKSARRLLDGDQGALKELRAEIADLREQKSVLLRAYGFSPDYMEMHYKCPDCQDTGLIEGRKCHCFLKAQMKLLHDQSNLEDVLERENFSALSFAYYDDKRMEAVLRWIAAQKKQVLLFSCQNREKEALDKMHFTYRNGWD